MSTRFIILIVAFSLGLLGISFYLLNSIDPGKKPKPTAEIINVKDHNLAIKSSFKLKTAEGKEFNQDNFKGKISLVYFGFTNCPDFCDESMTKINSIMSSLDAKDLANVQFVFVSVDPERDSLAVLAKYKEQFNNNIIALSGEVAELEKLTGDLKAYFSVIRPNQNDENYYVDHSAFMYLLDENANLVNQFTPHAVPEAIASQIKNYIYKD
jgi:protein SCO1